MASTNVDIDAFFAGERPNFGLIIKFLAGKRDSANEVLMRDPSLVEEDSHGIISFPGGHNEGFPDTSKQIFKEIYEDIRNGRSKDPPYSTFKDGLRELILCEKIIESNKKQAWVKVN